MIGGRSCQCWCVGCQNRWWSTEEDSSLEFKTSKVWTNNDTLNVSPHPASRVLVSFICLILAHSARDLCWACAPCWGTVSYRGIIAVFLLHRARLCPLVYRLRAVSFFLVRGAKRLRHACDWRCVTGEFLASRVSRLRCSMLAQACTRTPLAKRETARSLIGLSTNSFRHWEKLVGRQRKRFGECLTRFMQSVLFFSLL